MYERIHLLKGWFKGKCSPRGELLKPKYRIVDLELSNSRVKAFIKPTAFADFEEDSEALLRLECISSKCVTIPHGDGLFPMPLLVVADALPLKGNESIPVTKSFGLDSQIVSQQQIKRFDKSLFPKDSAEEPLDLYTNIEMVLNQYYSDFLPEERHISDWSSLEESIRVYLRKVSLIPDVRIDDAHPRTEVRKKNGNRLVFMVEQGESVSPCFRYTERRGNPGKSSLGKEEKTETLYFETEIIEIEERLKLLFGPRFHLTKKGDLLGFEELFLREGPEEAEPSVEIHTPIYKPSPISEEKFLEALQDFLNGDSHKKRFRRCYYRLSEEQKEKSVDDKILAKLIEYETQAGFNVGFVERSRVILDLCRSESEGSKREKKAFDVFASRIDKWIDDYNQSLLPINKIRDLYCSDRFCESVIKSDLAGDYLNYFVDIIRGLQTSSIEELRQLLRSLNEHTLTGVDSKLRTMWSYSDASRRILFYFSDDLGIPGNGICLLDYTVKHPDYERYRDMDLSKIKWEKFSPEKLGLSIERLD